MTAVSARPARRTVSDVSGAQSIVGRGAELAVLDGVLDRLARRPMVHVVGEPGIGKSGLLSALAGLAAARDVPMVVGRATEFEAHAPFAAVVDALDEPIAEALADGTVTLDAATVAQLADVFPSLDVPPADVDAEPHKLFRAVRAALESLAGPRGLVVAFDDVHWADQATLDLLRYLVRRPPAEIGRAHV